MKDDEERIPFLSVPKHSLPLLHNLNFHRFAELSMNFRIPSTVLVIFEALKFLSLLYKKVNFLLWSHFQWFFKNILRVLKFNDIELE